jgi:glycosyltransferase involved in cell wall biosynthesis
MLLSNRLFIHATNVHQGGGRSLLAALLRTISVSSGALALLDSRMPAPEGMRVRWVMPTVIERFKAERWLADIVRPGDVVLCFGNLPPLFKLRGHSMVFLQNRYLIDDVELGGFPLNIRVRLIIERMWLFARMANADEFFVQTPTMRRLLEIKIRGNIPVYVRPFMDVFKGYPRRAAPAVSVKNENCDFLYVASGEPHKNHLRTVEAWCLLAEEGLFPSLRLTLDETLFSTLCRDIEKMRQLHGLKLINMGPLSHCDVLALYKDVDALIYPSTFESFGLPLIEARQAGLPVLASELDYVRDLFDPEQTFDPDSAISIARAVKRFLGWVEPPLPLEDSAGFIKYILKRME